MSADARPAGLTIDPVLTGSIVVLAALGAVMVGSASISLADQRAGEPLYFLVRHFAALGMGTVALLLLATVPTELWYRLHWVVLAAAFALLVLVLLPGLGLSANGSTRWLVLGPMQVQASEPARLCLLLYIASYAVRHAQELATSLKGFAKPMLIVACAAALLLAEPDFGATVVLLATTLGLLFVGGARLRDFLLAMLVGAAALGALALTSPERRERLTTFLNPWDDPFDSGFQLTQSLIAIGRGEWLGVGLGASVQKLFYLPEAHTDFVFAVLAEELGFAGATLVIALFALIVYRAIKLGQQAMASGLPFQGLVATGIGLMLGMSAFINIGVNAGLLPTKGLTLPLVSYGRSSTIVTLAAVGLLLRIHHEVNGRQKRLLQRGHVR
jgi:cell division protein FtsW